jgi:ribosomal protein S18 acetylase RimI-like enzyme
MTRVEKCELGDMSIESLQPRDVAEISRTLASMEPWRKLDYKPEALAFYLLRADPSLKRYSITIAGKVSGGLSVRFPWLFGPFIELIALFDNCRGKGHGRQLIDWVARNFPQSPNLWATVSSFNLDAQKFYHSAGFEQVAVLQDLIREGRHEILLRKRL